MAALASNPDWHAAAQAVIDHFEELPDQNDRIELLEQLCDRLGGSLYPGLLHILYVIEKHAANDYKINFVETLSYGLSTGRLPSGKMQAWGANVSGNSAYAQPRNLCPLEFLCVWYSQPTSLPDLSSHHFTLMCTGLIRLFSLDEQAAELYKAKLGSDVLSPTAGVLSSRTRSGISALVSAWQENSTPEEITKACLAACEKPANGLDQLGNSSPFSQPFQHNR